MFIKKRRSELFLESQDMCLKDVTKVLTEACVSNNSEESCEGTTVDNCPIVWKLAKDMMGKCPDKKCDVSTGKECPICKNCKDVASEIDKSQNIQKMLNKDDRDKKGIWEKVGNLGGVGPRFWWCRWVAVENRNDDNMLKNIGNNLVTPRYILKFWYDNHLKYKDMPNTWKEDPLFDTGSGNAHDLEGFGMIQFAELRRRYGSNCKTTSRKEGNDWVIYQHPNEKRNDAKRIGEIWPQPPPEGPFERKAAEISKTLEAEKLLDTLPSNKDDAVIWLCNLEKTYAGSYFHVDDMQDDQITETITRLFCYWVLAVRALYPIYDLVID